MKQMLLKMSLILLAALSVGSARAQQEPINMEQFTKALQTLTAANTNAATAVVDFRALKALLPEALDGFRRTKASGEKQTVMGMTAATAEASYEAGDGETITIKLSDNAGMGGIMAFTQAAWTASEMDRETDTGFERTATYKGHKTHEEYDSSDRRGKIDAIVGGRFNVEVEGSQVAWEALQAALDKLDLDKLAALQNASP